MRHRWSISLLVSFLAVVIGAAFVLSGCTGSRNLASVSAYSLFSHEALNLPIKGKKSEIANLKSEGYTSFRSSKTLNELYETISDNTDLSIVQYDSSILIKKTGDHYTDHYCIRREKNDRYVFSGMRGKLITAIDSNGNKIKFAILLPVHLITDSLIIESTDQYALYIDVEYEIRGTMADIEHFYKESGWYEITCEEDELIISGYQNPQDVFIDSTTSSVIGSGSLEINQSYHIRVSNHDGKSFFSVSLN